MCKIESLISSIREVLKGMNNDGAGSLVAPGGVNFFTVVPDRKNQQGPKPEKSHESIKR